MAWTRRQGEGEDDHEWAGRQPWRKVFNTWICNGARLTRKQETHQVEKARWPMLKWDRMNKVLGTGWIKIVALWALCLGGWKPWQRHQATRIGTRWRRWHPWRKLLNSVAVDLQLSLVPLPTFRKDWLGWRPLAYSHRGSMRTLWSMVKKCFCGQHDRMSQLTDKSRLLLLKCQKDYSNIGGKPGNHYKQNNHTEIYVQDHRKIN